MSDEQTPDAGSPREVPALPANATFVDQMVHDLRNGPDPDSARFRLRPYYPARRLSEVSVGAKTPERPTSIEPLTSPEPELRESADNLEPPTRQSPIPGNSKNTLNSSPFRPVDDSDGGALYDDEGEEDNEDEEAGQQSVGDDDDGSEYFESSPAPVRQSRSRTTTLTSKKTKRSPSDEDGNFSPGTAPTRKKIRSTRRTPDSVDEDDERPITGRKGEETTAQPAVARGQNKSEVRVDLSVAKGLNAVEFTTPRRYTLAQLDNMTKCRKAVVRDFAHEITADGFNGEIKILSYRLESFDRPASSATTTYQGDKWEAVASSNTELYADWVSRAVAAGGDQAVRRIQLLVLDESDAAADVGQETLVHGREKSRAGEKAQLPAGDDPSRPLNQRTAATQPQVDDTQLAEALADLKIANDKIKSLKTKVTTLQTDKRIAAKDYKSLSEKHEALEVDYDELYHKEAETAGKNAYLETQKTRLEEEVEELKKTGHTKTDAVKIATLVNQLNQRKAELELLGNIHARVAYYTAAKGENKKLRKALKQTSLDLEYAAAGYESVLDHAEGL